MRKVTPALLVLIVWAFLVIGVLALPSFGSFPKRSSTVDSVSTYYLENTAGHTGALNVVSAIVWDYRGYDTLGEVTILFTAVCGVVAIMRRLTAKEED